MRTLAATLLLSLSSLAFAGPQATPTCEPKPGFGEATVVVMLTPENGGAPVCLRFDFVSCAIETPRDEPPAPAFMRRTYKSLSGSLLSVFDGDAPTTSYLYLRLSDGRSAQIGNVPNAAIAAGEKVQVPGVLLVTPVDKELKGGAVVKVTASVRAVDKAAAR